DVGRLHREAAEFCAVPGVEGFLGLPTQRLVERRMNRSAASRFARGIPACSALDAAKAQLDVDNHPGSSYEPSIGRKIQSLEQPPKIGAINFRAPGHSPDFAA